MFCDDESFLLGIFKSDFSMWPSMEIVFLGRASVKLHYQIKTVAVETIFRNRNIGQLRYKELEMDDHCFQRTVIYSRSQTLSWLLPFWDYSTGAA